MRKLTTTLAVLVILGLSAQASEDVKSTLAKRHASSTSSVQSSGASQSKADAKSSLAKHKAQAESAIHPASAPHKDSAASQAEHKTLNTPEEIWADLLEGNLRFVAGHSQPHNLVSLRKELVQGQHPQVIVLTCSDSRVSPTLTFDKTLGELFVVRTAGNVADAVALGSLEYAAEHLHSKVLVVLGHEKCGAVAAAASGEKMPSPNLQAIVNRIAPALDKVRACAKGDQLMSLGIEANVQQSAQDILANSTILREEVEAGKLTVIKSLYRLKSGEVTRLE